MSKWTIAATVAFMNFGFFTGNADANHQYGNLVSGYYQKYLGRPADPTGLQNWICQIEHHGRSPLWVEAQFLGCHEYFARYGCCPERFVRGLFLDVLCEPNPCPKEVGYWVSRLQRCGFNRCAFALDFLRHPHRRPGPSVSISVISTPPPPIHIHTFSPPPQPRHFHGHSRHGFGPRGCSSGFGPRPHFPHH